MGSLGSPGLKVSAIPLQQSSSENSGVVEANVFSFTSPITPPFTSTDSLHHDRKLNPGRSDTEIRYEYDDESFTLMFRSVMSLT